MSRASAVYSGVVSHARRGPRPHGFSYRLWMLYLDLDELPALLQEDGGPLREGRLGVLSFQSADYLRDPASGAAAESGPALAERVRDLVERELAFRPAGPVRLLTHVRSFGYVFNPVSFYYCFAADGRTLQAVVGEVTNTPWGERHPYVLSARPHGADARFPKRFHVSPFFDLDQGYRWTLTAPGERLHVEMRNEERGEEVFRATLSLERREWSAAALWTALLAQPLMAWKVHAAIYWQALLLWRKGTPFFTHPAKRAAPAARRT